MKKYLFAILFFSTTGIKAQVDKNLSYTLSIGEGYVLQTNDFVKGVNKDNKKINTITNLSLRITKQVNNSNHWHTFYNDFHYGLGVYHGIFNYSDKLGNPFALYAFAGFSPYGYKNFTLKNELALGLSGSGTTMIQSSELGINAIGVDVSLFNTLLANSKIVKYNFLTLKAEIDRITYELKEFIGKTCILDFENELQNELSSFNNKYFPSPEYKYKLRNKEIEEKEYGKQREDMFLPIYLNLTDKYGIKLEQQENITFLDKWYVPNIREEINCVTKEINNIKDYKIKNIMSIILSRTIRSCRATTHSDLATLTEPIKKTYYCHKHGKICKPLFSILKWWKIYSADTIKRLQIFDSLRTNTF